MSNVTNHDEHYMKRALELANLALGRTSPNPVVGAVIVKDGEIVGEGFHRKAGTPHAEVHALNAAKDKAKGATMYVTLEPCSHYGRTPPCTEAILKAGIKEVVIATLDPNPKVAGNGLKILQNAGVITRVGILEDEALRQNEFFFKYITTKLPFICMKYAMTLDGKIATSTGDAKWISNEESRRYVHYLRNIYDAVLVGVGTVKADDPRLNTRLDIDEQRDPIRVIIDSKLEIPLESNIVRTAHEQKTLVFTTNITDTDKANKLNNAGIEVIELNKEDESFLMLKIFKILAKKDITSVLVEGGAQVNASLIKEKLVDKVLCFVAPKIVGGNAISPIGELNINLMKNAYQLSLVEVERLGNDTLIKAYTGW